VVANWTLESAITNFDIENTISGFHDGCSKKKTFKLTIWQAACKRRIEVEAFDAVRKM
jgi:hypothetical protein